LTTEETIPRIETLEETDEFGRFQVEPLERGFGVTVGNAMRRVLLSALQGAAVTSVRVDGVYHEFDTLPGVKEDTTELILNIKQLRVKSHTDQPVSLRLMSTGPGLVTASDLIYPAEVEIANPELHIATLDGPEARLELELTIEAGKGYLPSDGREAPALGVIPVDAIFTPVRRVNYSVDSTRVGARTDFDRLVIEIVTDGTIRPTEAMAQAANLLIQHFAIIADLTRGARPGEKPTLGVGAVPPHVAEMPIEQLELSQRTYNCLKRSQITRVGQILEKSSDELLQLRNFGQKSLQELQEKLRGHGLSLPGTDLESSGDMDEFDDEADDELASEEDDEMGPAMVAGDVVGEAEEPEDDLEIGFTGIEADELEDEDERVGQRGSRGRSSRGRRGTEDWE
jgi:DNA-directed RNA polymerase subunit alpha